MCHTLADVIQDEWKAADEDNEELEWDLVSANLLALADEYEAGSPHLAKKLKFLATIATARAEAASNA